MEIYKNEFGVSVNAIAQMPPDKLNVDGSLYFLHAGDRSSDVMFHHGNLIKGQMNGYTAEAVLAMVLHHLEHRHDVEPTIAKHNAIEHIKLAVDLLSTDNTMLL